MGKIKVCVNGAGGKMGRMIASLVLEDPALVLSALAESREYPGIGKPFGDSGVNYSAISVREIETSDVIIDFSLPEATAALLKQFSKARKKNPLVIGTTGFDNAGKKLIAEAAETCPVVFSPNMSLGVNLLFKLVEIADRVLADYDKEIIEFHHNKKKDSPSGTALKLAEFLRKGRDRKYIYGREGILGERKKEEVGVLAVRAGDIIGDHTVLFAGNSERIELIHRAHSRENFARGAITAAKWVIGKKAGLYSMSDVLGL